MKLAEHFLHYPTLENQNNEDIILKLWKIYNTINI